MIFCDARSSLVSFEDHRVIYSGLATYTGRDVTGLWAGKDVHSDILHIRRGQTLALKYYLKRMKVLIQEAQTAAAA